ncbi:hypothetical protein CFC21_010787 [Triticum aestivum]|nr:cytochrome P450 72A14 [Aegilops tauschii subsp. strangulata]XP_044440124.1 cytochrome P450 72A14-like isoform X2 [Triticum aestivum]KAF6993988.1 hypothetical protein CFC21_010787 [Triticum aestivum]
MVLQAAATSLVASLQSPWSVLCGAAALLVIWAAALAAESYWLRPRRLGRALRAQGLGGTSYRFPAGDSAENARQSLEALSKPMPPSCHDVLPRVMPHLHNTVKEHGEVCVTWDGPDPKVVIAKPELVTEILSSNSGHFEKLRTNLGDLVCRGVGSYDGEKWARHRRILNPAFHLEKLKAMFPAFSTCCTELVDRWESKLLAAGSEGSVELDVSQEFPVLTGDVITRTSFGSSFTEGRRIFELQVDQAKRLMKLLQYLYIPGFLSFLTENNRRMWENKREIEGLVRGVVEKRERAMDKDGAIGNDMLGLMLQSNRSSNSDLRMSTQDVIQECKLFYFAGMESTQQLLTWTVVMLRMYPEWQDRAREEVLGVFGRDGKPGFDGLNRLKTMTMILYEVLRLYTPVVTMNRKISKEMQIGGVTYPAGTVLELPFLMVHHNPDVWGEDVSEFKPQRFAEGISKATKNGQVGFFPFGWGPRICIGNNFAMLEAKMAVSMILQRFEFRLSPSYAHAPCTVITLHPQHGAQIMLKSL